MDAIPPRSFETISEWLSANELDSVRVLPSVPFDPSYNGQAGLLVPGYYVSHPIYRGHTNGTVTLPNGQSWASLQVATLKHAYAYKPIQKLLSTYTRMSTFVGASTLNWYTAVANNGKGV